MTKTTIKVIVAGDGGVGKTSFLNRLVHDCFKDNELTRGVDFFSKQISFNSNLYNFILWDFAGQDQFKKIVEDFLDGSIAAFVLFDLTRIVTLEGVNDWLVKLNQLREIPVILIGNKYDLISKKECTLIDHLVFDIKANNDLILDYVKISSKTGENVERAFEILLKSL
jgi:small GTP-binding protein